jgi:hypothetical protein
MEASVPAVAQEPCSDPGTRPELRIPNAAAHTPLKSARKRREFITLLGGATDGGRAPTLQARC